MTPEEEMNIDFEKIKKFFKNAVETIKKITLPQTQNQEQNKEAQNPQTEDWNKDIQKIKEFAIKNKTILVITALLLLQFIPNYGFLPWGGIEMRMQFEDLPLSEIMAERIVYNNLLQQTYGSISEQQPNIPEPERKALAKTQIDEVFDNDQRIVQEIKKIKNSIKTEYTYSTNGQTYTMMPDIDTYYYLRLANNVVQKGILGDRIKNGRPWDDHATAPIGSNVSIELHPYTLAYMHKIARIFNPKIPLMQSATYFPIIMTIIGILAIFVIGRTLTNNLGGFVTATIFSLNYVIFIKTMWGMTDTDAYNITIPIIFAILFIETITSKQLRKTILLAIATTTLLTLYSFIWAGWWYLIHIVIATTAIYLAYCIKKWNANKTKENKEDIKKTIYITLLLLILLSAQAIIALSYHEFAEIRIKEGISMLAEKILAPILFTKISAATKIDLWPNVYTSVSELTPISLNEMLKIGGNLFFIAAILGTILLIKQKNILQNKKHKLYSIFLIIWMLATIYATIKGRRFMILLIPPLTISAGYFITYLHEKIQTKKNKLTKILAVTFTFSILLLIVMPNLAQMTRFLQDMPVQTSEAWWKTLTTIKENSQKNAIITSWWDFGHQFAYLADRPVTFDGGSQNTPMAHWVGRMLTTSDEKEAIAILRMLACGSNRAYDEIYAEIQEPIKTINMVHKLLQINKKEDVKKYLAEQKIRAPERIAEFTHCNPPENFIITSEDMSRKAQHWTQFSNWNFEKAYILQQLKNKPEDEAINYMMNSFSYSKEKAEKTYEQAQEITSEDEIKKWISPQSGYGETKNCITKADQIICQNTASINLQKKEAQAMYKKQPIKPKNIVYIDETTGKFTSIEIEPESPVGIILTSDDNGNYQARLSNAELTTSMFTRLMYFDGHGLAHFKPVTKQSLMEGGHVSAWKADWNGTTQNTMPSMQTKNEVTNNSTITFNSITWINEGKIVDSTITNWKTKNITPEEKFEKQQTQPRTRTIGKQQIVPAIENAIIGMKAHETKTIRIKPQELTNEPEILKQIQNNTINFRIKIEKIR